MPYYPLRLYAAMHEADERKSAPSWLVESFTKWPGIRDGSAHGRPVARMASTAWAV